MTSLFPYLILAVLFVRGITLEGSVQGIIYYLKPEFSQTPLCTGQSSSTISSQSSTDSSLLRSVIIYYLKPEFHRLLSAQVSHHLLPQTRIPQTPLCTGQSSSTISNQISTDPSLHMSVIIYYLKPEFHRLPSAQVSHTLLPHTWVPQTPLCTGQLSSTTVSNHYLHETETHFYTDWSSSTQTRVP